MVRGLIVASRVDSSDPFGPISDCAPERLGLEDFDLIAEAEDPDDDLVENLDAERQVEFSAGT